jgi:hypothetical protein
MRNHAYHNLNTGTPLREMEPNAEPGSIPSRSYDTLSPKHPDRLWGPTGLCNSYGWLFIRFKATGAWSLPLTSSDETRNTRSHTSILPYDYIVWYISKHEEEFTFTSKDTVVNNNNNNNLFRNITPKFKFYIRLIRLQHLLKCCYVDYNTAVVSF